VSDPVDTTLQAAFAHHQRGDLRSARDLYQEVLARQPKHAHALHLLGVLSHQEGRNESAKALISEAISADPRIADMHNNLGEVVRTLGEAREAARHYREALVLDPEHRLAHNNLGLALHQLGDLEGAEKAFRDALRVSPDTAEIHNNLGVVGQSLGRLEQAEQCFRRALELDPAHVPAGTNLGNVLLERGRSDEARQRLEQAVDANPDNIMAWDALARVLEQQGEYDAAVVAIGKASASNPREPRLGLRLGATLRRAGRLDESIHALRSALADNPRHAELLNDLGVSLQFQGHMEEAVGHFQQALERDPGLGIAYENLSLSKKFGLPDRKFVSGLETLAGTAGIPAELSMHLGFALAKILDDMGEYERAFGHLKSANALKRATIECDLESVTRFVDESCTLIDAAFMDERRHLASTSEAPVFIVGMPRSGTTLVEQILASHPEIHGGGEIDYFGRVTSMLATGPGDRHGYPRCLSSLDSSTADDITRAYLGHLRDQMAGESRFTDKMPLNFEHLGLIALLFSNARIIHCRRDPLDVCLSNYFQHFAHAHEFAYDLGEIAAFHRLYERLMAHWQRVLPGRILDVHYEDLVQNSEAVSRQLVDHLGLAWSEQCLAFHASTRPVDTASAWQVRQPIHTGSVQRWKRYEVFLGELIGALGG
jgi:tetratricopeptide (TPR) repeat protein